MERSKIRSTTIIGIRRNGKVALGGDGQVTFGDTVLKSSALKLRRLYDDTIIAGFAGATADAFALFEKFEAKLDEYGGNLPKSVVELAKDWRTDKNLRRLEAMLIIMDKKYSTYEIRVRAVEAVRQGMALADVAQAYQVNRSTVHRWFPYQWRLPWS